MHARHRSRFVLGLLLGLVACTARAIAESPEGATRDVAMGITPSGFKLV